MPFRPSRVGAFLVPIAAFLALYQGLDRIRTPAPLFATVGVAPGSPPGESGAWDGGEGSSSPAASPPASPPRVVFVVQLMDCADLRDHLAEWIARQDLLPEQVRGVLLGPSAGLDRAREILATHGAGFTLETRGGREITRFLRRSGYHQTPVVLVFDEGGRLRRLLDGPSLAAEVAS